MDEEAKKAGEDALKKLSEDRDRAMKKLGINPIGPMDGHGVDRKSQRIGKRIGDSCGDVGSGAREQGEKIVSEVGIWISEKN